MTSVDTSLNYLASILVRDVYIKVRRSISGAVPGESQQLLAARITAFALGVLAIVTAIIVQRTKGVFDFALMYYSWFGPSMLTPVMLGLVFTKTPSWSAIAAATVSLVFVLIFNTLIDIAPYQYEVNIFGGIVISGAVFFLSTLWPERNTAAQERIAAYHRDLHTPALGEGSGWDRNALASYRIVGVLTIGIGIAVLLLLLVPTNASVRTLGLLIGLGTIGLGGVMLWYFRTQLALSNVKEKTPAARDRP
jgi:hypothetical protein